MSAIETTNTDIEHGGCRHRSSRPSVACSSDTTTSGSLCFSDSEDHSQHSPLDSTAGGSSDECRFSEIEGISYPQSHRESSVMSDKVDLESGDLEVTVHADKEERDCRICHLNLVGGGGGNQDCGVAIELGCACKGDLGAAHKHCAETWFKIRGNTTCEICGATALNVAGEQKNVATGAAAGATATPVFQSETRNVWHGRRIMNILLACMIFAFLISWFLHFNVLP